MNKVKGIIDAILYYFIIFLAQKITYFFHLFILFERSEIKNQAFEIAKNHQSFYIITGWIIGIGIIFIIFKIFKAPTNLKLKKINKLSIMNMLLSTVTGFGLVIFINGVFYVVSKYVFSNTIYDNNLIIYEGNFIVTMFTVGIITVVFEEILFRGFIMERLLEVGSITFAIIVQGVLFSISHLNLILGISVFLVGIISGYAVVKTKSLISGMIIHGVFNIVNLYLYKNNHLFYDAGQLMIFVILGFILICFGVERLRSPKDNFFDNK